ncbi:MAG: hypothetical protein DRP78_06205 [Candidatus Omnitrophota bacterium]|nr:MAG: hypothetical protein DRP78_06205 [Candidatus Omnitrophota bacterium]
MLDKLCKWEFIVECKKNKLGRSDNMKKASINIASPLKIPNSLIFSLKIVAAFICFLYLII